ncbi:hypothetical protein JCM19237_4370 [Photobacterium aphoticum]|uniref:Uncharacterized protein n=1 Tax=Photobacterium aphoticum TaxID=754436 RepID=A0A090QT76_9GAMM|nr:hypothetical protein JCM19237_4370 [Photobacterium aphoticum]
MTCRPSGKVARNGAACAGWNIPDNHMPRKSITRQPPFSLSWYQAIVTLFPPCLALHAVTPLLHYLTSHYLIKHADRHFA